MKRMLVLPLFLMPLFAVDSYAASGRVDIVPGAKGVYYVKAVDFAEVGGVEVEVQYDTKTLSNPRIDQGPKLASTMFIPNPNCNPPTCSKPSSVKIAAMSLSPISGSGDLAIITFDVKGETAGFVNKVRSKLVETSGTPVVQTKPPVVPEPPVVDPNTDTLPPPPPPPLPPPPPTVTADTTYGTAGSISLPTDPLAPTERKADYLPLVTELRKDITAPPPGSDAASATAAAKPSAKDKEAEKKFQSFDNVLQLFKAFKGERTMKAMISLFADAEIPAFTQSPPVAIADGKTPVKITLVVKPSGDESPKFIMQGASVKQLSSEGEAVTWIIEAVPKKDVYDVLLTVIDGSRILEYPLTVSPQINPLLSKGKKLSEADFALYLAKPPKFDFNKDKKFDAIDDFIYTANYIVAMKIKPEKSAKPEKSTKPESREKSPADKKDATGAKELPAKDGTVKGGEKTPPKAPLK